ncbi:hypothetical protein pb186bvf_009394 [Paramecium bursaria]
MGSCTSQNKQKIELKRLPAQKQIQINHDKLKNLIEKSSLKTQTTFKSQTTISSQNHSNPQHLAQP